MTDSASTVKTANKSADKPVVKKTTDMLTYSGLIHNVTVAYLDDIDETMHLKPQAVAGELIAKCNTSILQHNLVYKDEPSLQWHPLSDLLPQQIARCLAKLHHIVLISLTDKGGSSDYDVIAMYQESGINKGIYVTDENLLMGLSQAYNYNLTTNGFKEVKSTLRTLIKHVYRTKDADLIPVNNGIFNYRTKTLLPFNPKFVFLAKSHVNYNSHATSPLIHNDKDGTDWDVDSWMASLSDDPQVVHILWQILGAIVRPNVSWDKSAWLYSTKGNNGKGTLCELMRNLCGPGSYAKVSLRDFSQDFMLEPLVHATAIITDENDVGTYIDKAANLKAVETGDVITINRKYKSVVAYQFKGFMVQCLNEFPKVKDKSGSFYRRQIFIPMTKNFQGHERRYIKQDYLSRQDVLEYVLFHVLHDTNYYELDVPQASLNLMNEYKSYNDPIRQFIDDIIPECQWNLLPFDFLYDLYRSWFKRNHPNGKAVANNNFITELHSIFDGQIINGFTCTRKQIRTAKRMSMPEPMILDYDLRRWENPTASGADQTSRTIPQVKERYYGLVRSEG